jgi:hypothetical protein
MNFRPVMTRWARWLLAASLAVQTACAQTHGQGLGPAPFPGNYPSYAWGTAQLKENFENVDVAQIAFGLFKSQRAWGVIAPTAIPSATIIGLGQYLPFSVRWKLKDGREYILENIDTAAVMREYFKTHTIKLQWQAEGRPRFERGGDYDPLLALEVVGDSVVVKWIVRVNHTPPSERFLPSGAAVQWNVSREVYEVTRIKGNLTSGIDFNTRMEFFDDKGARK